jgi:hypothetical protein
VGIKNPLINIASDGKYASRGNYCDLKFVLPFRQSDWDGFQFRRINSAVMKIRLFKPVLF